MVRCCFQGRFCPVKKENQAVFFGMSLTTFRDVPISVCRFSTVAVGRMSGKLIIQLCGQKTDS